MVDLYYDYEKGLWIAVISTDENGEEKDTMEFESDDEAYEYFR